jgi:hypothetical protein
MGFGQKDELKKDRASQNPWSCSPLKSSNQSGKLGYVKARSGIMWKAQDKSGFCDRRF